MNEQIETVNKVAKRNEIDFVILVNKLWNGRKTILKGLGVGTVFGLIFAIFTPKEFTVTTTMMPQSESGGGMGKFSSLAAIAGFDLDLDAGSDISPVVYPQIVSSEDFMFEIMNSKYNFKKVDKPVTMFDYYSKYQKENLLGIALKYTLGLPGVIVEAIRKDPPKMKSSKGEFLQLTKDQDKLMIALKEQINLSVNKKEGYLSLTCIFPEPLLAAQVAKKAQELLQDRITGYKIKKSSEQLKFIEQRYNEKKASYENIQNKLAGYRDRNLNVFTATAGTEQERLQSEYSIAYSVYSELAKQLEQAKIQVKNDTPVFAILKPIVVPIKKTKPSRFVILFMWMVVGSFIGAGLVAGKEYLAATKKFRKS